MRQPGGGCDLDVVGGQAAVLDIDPETVETAGHPQVVDEVVMEHPPDGEDHQPFPSLETVFHQLGHGFPQSVR
ncbi:MAG: hypothetical protein ABWZ58_09295 [Acidimicrobiia bacterium]